MIKLKKGIMEIPFTLKMSLIYLVNRMGNKSFRLHLRMMIRINLNRNPKVKMKMVFIKSEIL